jgi:hypothetical protein
VSENELEKDLENSSIPKKAKAEFYKKQLDIAEAVAESSLLKVEIEITTSCKSC